MELSVRTYGVKNAHEENDTKRFRNFEFVVSVDAIIELTGKYFSYENSTNYVDKVKCS